MKYGNIIKENTKESYTLEELYELKSDYSYEEAIENLKNGKCEDFIKIFSIISLENIKEDDVLALFSNLVNQSNPVREACAFKIEELSEKFYKKGINFFQIFFQKQELIDIFLKATVDINPNVSRAICSVISKNKALQEILEPKIIKECEKNIEELEKEDIEQKNRKSHAKNKKMFAIFWLLEALCVSISQKRNEEIIKILNKTINFKDYTLREKTAKILMRLENIPKELLDKIKSDENFYVKKYV